METNVIDVSEHQGDINWSQVQEPIAIIKMSGGDAGLYVDAKANKNYYGAKAAGKKIGMYHFAGGKDPVNEADFFIAACSPLEEDDVMILDWELNKQADPVGWCHAFIQRIIDRTHTIPMIYMSSSRTMADRDANNNTRLLDWTPVVNQNVGLWVANYSVSTADNVSVKYWPYYLMHQYSSNGRVSGVPADVDQSVWFGDVVQFTKYGFHNPQAAQPVPAPVPDPPVVVAPPVAQPDPTPATTVPEPGKSTDPDLDDIHYGDLDMDNDPIVPGAVTTPTTPPVVVNPTPTVVVHPNNLKATILTAITAVAAALAALLAWLHQ